MRFAPPNPLRIADRAAGMNAIAVRSYNERLVLSLLLQNDGLSRMEIGQRTGLSAQTVSVLVRSLEQEGLVSQGEAKKGRIGPPTIPLSLNATGAYSVGISIGHKQTDVVLIDFVGHAKFHTAIKNVPPDTKTNQSGFLKTVEAAVNALPNESRGRIAGIGLALPEDSHELSLAPSGAGERYEALSEEIEAALGIEVYVQNDINAAAAGESLFGAAKSLSNYLYCYLGARLHCRLVLNHRIFNGVSQLSYDVGLLRLEEELTSAGHDTSVLWKRGANWPDFGTIEVDWQDACVDQLDQVLTLLSQFVPLKTVVVSSYAPRKECEAITQKLAEKNDGLVTVASDVDISPKAIGAASLPFSSKFMVE
ncbi:MAG: ROK family transcriptional regulator [Pseudomonadota bacterium]